MDACCGSEKDKKLGRMLIVWTQNKPPPHPEANSFDGDDQITANDHLYSFFLNMKEKCANPVCKSFLPDGGFLREKYFEEFIDLVFS